MTTKTVRSKDAARPRPGNITPKSKPAATSPVTERLRKEARAGIAANLAALGAAPGSAAADHNEQGGKQPGQPAPQEPKHDSPKPARKIGKGDHQRGSWDPEAAAPAKPIKPVKPPAAPKPKRLSCLDAAAMVIGKDPVGCADLVAEMAQRKLWSSPNGKTPEASLYAAIIREISAKKSEARFKKVDRGLFVAGPGANKRN